MLCGATDVESRLAVAAGGDPIRFFRVFLAACLAVLAVPATADVTLRYAPDETGGLPMVIAADDEGNIRAQNGEDQALIVRGSETWLAIRRDGEWAVVRFEDALAIGAETRGEPSTAPPLRNRLVDRGAQRIGQWEGRLYWIEPLPPIDGRLRSEIVIATDSALQPAGLLFARIEDLQAQMFLAAFAAPPSDYVALTRGLFERGLMLRIEGRYRLESVSREPVPAAHYALPGPVLSRDAYRARLDR